jgi:hypothetical protein
MSGYCNHCGYDRCLCFEIETDLKKFEQRGIMNTRPTPESDAHILKETCLAFDSKTAKLLQKLETERNEARFDLEFRRELYKLQEQTLDMLRESLEDVRKQRDGALEIARRATNMLKDK